ncbi:MAG: histidine phosphatase family protein [Pseudomonadota bacterium]
MHTLTATLIAAGFLAAAPLSADMIRVSNHVGNMIADMEAEETMMNEQGDLETLRFEPWQMLGEMFQRDDVVYLMRHGPTDWSNLDVKNVAPEDCENQRVMSEAGKQDMQNLGRILADNGILPGAIVVSEWCRNQQTLENLMAGFEAAEPGITDGIPVETSEDLNLLLSLQGAPDVSDLRERISNWSGSGGKGPLLLISHFTNVEELTQFTVYEGEVLVLDPKRDNRVLGYFRLSSAKPDIGHFQN